MCMKNNWSIQSLWRTYGTDGRFLTKENFHHVSDLKLHKDFDEKNNQPTTRLITAKCVSGMYYTKAFIGIDLWCILH